MLKIKDNIDLKELEQIGFKPRYDENTGELREYFYVNTKETSVAGFLGITIKKQQTRPKKLRIRHTFRVNKFGAPCVEENKIWVIDNMNYTYTDFDILYDLIQKGFVEKVEEKLI
jgi:hypothetical protein